jgi:regulator of sigma E protease
MKADPRSFASRPIWQRFAVLVAGVFMNLVLAAVLLGIGFGVGLPSIVDETVPSSAILSQESIRVMSVLADSPAALAGIQPGDELLSLDDKIFTSANEASGYIRSREGNEVKFLIQRGEDALSFSITAAEVSSHEGKIVGVGLVKTAMISYPWYLAGVKGVVATFVFTWEVVKAFGGLLWNLAVHQEVSADLSGPVGIAVMTGQAAALGFAYLLQFAAILSINLAVVNILPFPALDGGRLIFLFVEKLRGRAADEKWEGLVHNLGFIVLILLIVVVTVRDFIKL